MQASVPGEPMRRTGKTWPTTRKKEERAEERGEGKEGVPRTGNRGSGEAVIGGKISDKRKARNPVNIRHNLHFGYP